MKDDGEEKHPAIKVIVSYVYNFIRINEGQLDWIRIKSHTHIFLFFVFNI